MKSFLKWVGGKYLIKDKIIDTLSTGDSPGERRCQRLIEPFIGGGSIFLNTNYSNYLLADANKDLINLYETIKYDGIEFIKYARCIFENANISETYYYNRELYNTTNDIYLKSALFIYLNKHGYSGLYRTNSSGGFNVPFGSYKHPIFPELELLNFHNKSKQATFVVDDFINTMDKAVLGDVVYCDPPYSPIDAISNFTSYTANEFGVIQHILLKEQAVRLANKCISVCISNHDTEHTRELYSDAKIVSFPVRRNIASKSQYRGIVNELIAIYS